MNEIPSPDDDKENAVADWLLTNEPNKAVEPPATPAPSVAPDESYDVLGGGSHDENDEPPPITRPVAPRAPKVKDPEVIETEARATRTRSRKRGTVDEVWTRWAEWGPDVIRIGLFAALLLVPLYFAVSALMFFVAFLILVGGALILAVMSYPLAVTMERPVRITPEQALKDYYNALSHQSPHFRRMWLLLSSAGRSHPRFSTFPEFRAYWQKRLEMDSSFSRRRFNQYIYTIQDYKSEKSAGLTELDVKFTVNVRPRSDKNGRGQNYPVTMGLVKGPDKMWYLEDGAMPDV